MMEQAEEPYNSEDDSDYAPSEGEEEAPKPRKRAAPEVEEQEPAKNPRTVEPEKEANVDDLWADFLKAADETPSTSAPTKPFSEPVTKPKTPPMPTTPTAPKKTVEEIFQFAGEEVRVEREVDATTDEAPAKMKAKGPAKSGGSILSAIAGLSKAPKLSTLSKSKLDWDKFKSDNQLKEELATHNRGKDGYMDRQDFLQRTDSRQFERERESRNKSRKNPLS